MWNPKKLKSSRERSDLWVTRVRQMREQKEEEEHERYGK